MRSTQCGWRKACAAPGASCGHASGGAGGWGGQRTEGQRTEGQRTEGQRTEGQRTEGQEQQNARNQSQQSRAAAPRRYFRKALRSGAGRVTRADEKLERIPFW
jgi:hypothetical protein